MGQQSRTRKQTSVAYNANNSKAEQLGRGMIYREIMLRYQGQPTITATNNTVANTLAGDEWAAVKKIELIANGTDVIKSISGNQLWWLNYFMYGKAPRISALLGGGAANPSFDSVLILPLWMPGVIKPFDTALDARRLSSLEIKITWGDYTSINASATGWTTNPSIDVFSLESFGVEADFALWRLFQISETITASNTQHEIDLPVGHLYRGFMINSQDAAADQSDIINNIKVKSGTTIFADLHAQDDILQQWPMLRNGLPRNWNSNAGAYDNLRRGDANDIDGWYWLDLVTDGRLTEAPDTFGYSEFKLELDVTVGAGTTVITIVPLQIIPIRGKK